MSTPGSKPPLLSISIVSHGQMSLVQPLLHDIARMHAQTPLEVILTLNIPEPTASPSDFPYPLHILHNDRPAGFGTNHNQALHHARGAVCCILNPDVRIGDNPFPWLMPLLEAPGIGLVAPVVVNTAGEVEDSARRFPTPWRIAQRVLLRRRPPPEYTMQHDPLFPDWVAGMCMVVPTALFRHLRGFDEKFFLYYEDVDLCARIRLLGLHVALHPQARVVHDAQRSSHHKLRYFLWHASSMTRFFCSAVFIQLQWRRLAAMATKRFA